MTAPSDHSALIAELRALTDAMLASLPARLPPSPAPATSALTPAEEDFVRWLAREELRKSG